MLLCFSIVITIILSHAIIRICTILHIYLQVSETEGMTELHWVIGLNVLEKINSIYHQGISLVLSRMFFQERECAFNGRNLLNIKTLWVTTQKTRYLTSFNYEFSFKKKSYKNACLKFLSDTKLITSLLIFSFLVKIWSLLTRVFIDLMIIELVNLNS